MLLKLFEQKKILSNCSKQLVISVNLTRKKFHELFNFQNWECAPKAKKLPFIEVISAIVHCSKIFDSQTLTKHSNNCHVYEKWVKNGLECLVCSRSFKRRRDFNFHIGHHHKDVIKELVPFLNGVLFKNPNPSNKDQIPFWEEVIATWPIDTIQDFLIA